MTPLRIATLLFFAAGSTVAPILKAQTDEASPPPAIPLKNYGKLAERPADLDHEKTLYVVGYAHLDTQWRWTYPEVIDEFIANTLHNNFALLAKYPNYVFNFTGSRRYELMQEYYPTDFETLKKYVAEGRWFPAGSSVDEGDSIVPSAESLIRQVLYGNHYFRRQFGKASEEFMLPDCFGFPAALPSILAHCGIKGFSTQKLTWGSAAGIPFKIGVWVGPDGKSVVAALDPGTYVGRVEEDLSQSQGWLERINHTGAISGVYADYHYYGTGDRGGAPPEASVQWVEASVAGKGPVRVISSTSDRMVKDLTSAERARLPRYTGELLLVTRSAGSISSEAYMKKWNRKNELLADAAERASVAATWLGAENYPSDRLDRAWDLVLGSQMHDMLPGTSLPLAYQFCWNDEVLAQNQFTGALRDGVGGVAAAMDTTGSGEAVVVYNPLSVAREDVVEARVHFPGGAPEAVRVIGPDGTEAPSQVISRSLDTLGLIFVAKVPSVGFQDYRVERAAGAGSVESGAIHASTSGLENERYRVVIAPTGDIESIFDKVHDRELLAGPMRLAFQFERPATAPAWNMDWADQQRPPRGYVAGPARIRVLENGSVRVAVEISRESEGSRFVQTVRLCRGDAGNRVEFLNQIDWQSRECALKEVFPFTVANSDATYDGQIGVLRRGNNQPLHFEVPQHQWFDLTDHGGNYGIAVLNDCKFGSDKPDDHTMRLTLIYTPGVRDRYQDQASQDQGRHRMIFAVMGHPGGWSEGGVPWAAAAVNQPLVAAQVQPRAGWLGRSFSLLRVSTPAVAVMTLKKAEDSDEVVVRLNELQGRNASDVRVGFAAAVVAAREIDGQERPVAPAVIQDGELVTDVPAYSLRAFAVTLASPVHAVGRVRSQPVALNFNFPAATAPGSAAPIGFDGGRSYPAEALPPSVTCGGISFSLGVGTGLDAVACRGQEIPLSAGSNRRVYFLAAAAGGDVSGDFRVGDETTRVAVPEWTGYVGQWDTRLWNDPQPKLAYIWNDALAGLRPGYTKDCEVAWYSSHRHDSAGANEAYQYSYLFKCSLDVPDGARTLGLPDDPRIRIFALSVAEEPAGGARLCSPAGVERFDDHLLDAPRFGPEPGSFSDTTAVRIIHPLYWREACLHYTLDGSEPTPQSPVYDPAAPLEISQPRTIKVRYLDGALAGPVAEGRFDVQDTTPPRIVDAETIAGIGRVLVRFSEPVDPASASNPGNYQVADKRSPSSVELSLDGRSATLLFGAPVAAVQGEAVELPLRASGIADRSPAANRITAQTVPVEVERPVVHIAAAHCPEDAREVEIPALGRAWTLNMFVCPEQLVANRTLIAGFGTLANKIDGTGRYFAKYADGLGFWARNFEVSGDKMITTGEWQMLTATYDGRNLVVYKNGEKMGDSAPELAGDENVLRLGPLDPWDHRRRFHGELREVTAWPEALTPRMVQLLWEASR